MKQGWEDEKRVTLDGEFRYAGEYLLLPGETIGELIDRAGGFTEKAYLEAAIITRESVKKLEQKRLNEYVRQLEKDILTITAEMASKDKLEEAQEILRHQMLLLEKLRTMETVGRVVIDLTNPASYRDFLLEDGDLIYVPGILSTVSVIGEVYNPATFRLESYERRVDSYIHQSGGFKETADRKNTYVVRAGGSIFAHPMGNVGRYKLNPGDVVVVPRKIKEVSGYRIFIETIDAVSKVATTAGIAAAILVNTK